MAREVLCMGWFCCHGHMWLAGVEQAPKLLACAFQVLQGQFGVKAPAAPAVHCVQFDLADQLLHPGVLLLFILAGTVLCIQVFWFPSIWVAFRLHWALRTERLLALELASAVCWFSYCCLGLSAFGASSYSNS